MTPTSSSPSLVAAMDAELLMTPFLDLVPILDDGFVRLEVGLLARDKALCSGAIGDCLNDLSGLGSLGGGEGSFGALNTDALGLVLIDCEANLFLCLAGGEEAPEDGDVEAADLALHLLTAYRQPLTMEIGLAHLRSARRPSVGGLMKPDDDSPAANEFFFFTLLASVCPTGCFSCMFLGLAFALLLP